MNVLCICEVGEFYNNNSDLFNLIWNILGALTGAGISGIFALWIFKKGKKQDKVQEEEKDKKRIESDRKTFFTLLDNVVETSRIQVTRYEEHIANTKVDPLANLAPQELTFQDLNRILKFESKQVIELYDYLGFSNEDYVKVVKNLDYLSAVFNKIPEDFWDVKNNNIENLSNVFIQTKNEILNLMADYLFEQKLSNPDFEKDTLWLFFNELILDYYKDTDGKPELKYDYDKLINPLKVTLLRDFTFHKLSLEILKKTKVGGDIIMTIRTHNTDFVEDLTKAIERINKSIDKLEAQIQNNKRLEQAT